MHVPWTVNSVTGRPSAPALSLQSKFLQAIRSSYKMVTIVDVWTPSTNAWTIVPIVDGSVSGDIMSSTVRTAELTLAPSAATVGGQPIYTSRADIYGSYIKLWRGVDIFGEILVAPLGVYIVTNVRRSRPARDYRLSLADLNQPVEDARFLVPTSLPADTYVNSIQSLVRGALEPNVTPVLGAVQFSVESGITGSNLFTTIDRERGEKIRELQAASATTSYFDGEGVYQIKNDLFFNAKTAASVWSVDIGEYGVLLGDDNDVSRDSVYNAVVAQGEGIDPPVFGYAIDNGPTSPTRWTGPFGKKPRFYSNPLLTTAGQCQTAAANLLYRSISETESTNFSFLPNMLLEPGDVVTVDVENESGTIVPTKYMLHTLEYPLTAAGEMTATARLVETLSVSTVP